MKKRSTKLLLYLSLIAQMTLLTVSSKAETFKALATTISFHPEDLFENRPAGTLAGTLSVTADNLLNLYTYSLVPGSGDCSNELFEISGNKVQTVKPLDFEERKLYCIRVRATAQNGTSVEKSFSVAVNDVNEQPTLAPLADQQVCYTNEVQSLTMPEATAGPEKRQKLSFSVVSDQPELFRNLSISSSGRLSFTIGEGKNGAAKITVTVKDDGDTANGGVDSFSQSFTLTVDAPPVITITTNKGTTISKGEVIELTAYGGSTYRWLNPTGAISGTNSATLAIRPSASGNYRVEATSANGCVSQKEIHIEVKDDYLTLVPTNILTPNGDGKNDRLVIKNIDLYPDNEVKIFDKAGRLLFSKRNYNDEWDGIYQGNTLEEGAYFYIVDFGINKPKFKGHVTIIRD